MIAPPEDQAIEETMQLLSHWLGSKLPRAKSAAPSVGRLKHGGHLDWIIRLADAAFSIEYKQSGKVSVVASGIRQLSEAKGHPRNTVKLLVVPFMSEPGRKRCHEAGVSWLDLSGNADITATGIHIQVEGKPNKYKKPGRATSVFAPRSSRVARVLLCHQGSTFIQRKLSEMARLGEDYVSRIVHTLESQELIERLEDGSVTVKDPGLLLDAWAESYDFSKHTSIRGHIPARSGSALLEDLSGFFSKQDINFAATGLGAAWLYTHFAAFRIVTLFVAEAVNTKALSALGFKEGKAGSNTWLVVPNDESIFWETRELEGTRCVHPIQVYLDLKGHPERAEEAMSAMRRLVLLTKT